MSVLALVERLAPHIERELNLVIKSKEEADSLSSKLKKINVGLQEAEREGVTNPAVKDWLKQLEGVAHEMEDVLDEWEILNLQVQIDQGLIDKVPSLLLSLCSCFKQVLGRRENTKKIQALTGQIDKIFTERGKYDFVPGENTKNLQFRQEPSTSAVPKFGVYGRDSVKDSLVKDLTREGGEDDTQIVSIVGIGGVGKTTLAQMVYNDVDVGSFFNLKGWVSVSEPFDSLVVAKSILEAFGVKNEDAQNLETLVQKIKKSVQHERFLLILDNVWTEDRLKWENLRNCLDGGKGSRILVTTRSESVARMMGTSQWQPLNLLSDMECNEILHGIALKGRREAVRERLRYIGFEIAKRCNGLPLAAKSVGSMLALKSSEEEWRTVLKSPLWTYDDKVSDLFRLLSLSYVELSPVLKRCFLSSVVFPKGALISIDEIIRVWMAYGFLNLKASYDEVRMKGLQDFRNLEMRSFFQKVGSDEDDEDVEGYKMHDIMHDFGSYMLGSEYSFINNGRALLNLPSTSLGKLRTVCSRYVSEDDRFPSGVLSLVKSVRVLSLRNCKLELVPEQVGELAHLRYLDLSRNRMEELPEAVYNLYHLQTLGIEDCELLTRLPEGIEKLVNLRHILNRRSSRLFEYPQGLEKLSGLWTLSEYRGSKLGYLRNLNQLQGFLAVDICGGSAEVDQVLRAELGNKKHIKELWLRILVRARIEDAVVEALQPPPNLEILCTSGKWLSHWIQKSSLENLKILTFNGYFKSLDLPPFGTLPALEQLNIELHGFECLKTRALLGQNGFPKLKKLRFNSCSRWQEWEDIDEEEAADLKAMRCLEELEIIDCRKLRALPPSLLQHAACLKIIKLSGNPLPSHLFGDHGIGELSYMPNVKCVVTTSPESDDALFERLV